MKKRLRKRRFWLIVFLLVGFALAVAPGIIMYEPTVNAPLPRLAYEDAWTLTVYVSSAPVVIAGRKTYQQYLDEYRAMFASASAKWDYDRVTVKINSSGGWTVPATALGVALSELPERVSILITGDCKSAAVNILAYSDPDEVRVTKNASILVHQRRENGGGSTGNPEGEIRGIARLTGQSLNTVRTWFEQGATFDWRQAIDAGWTGMKKRGNRT